MNGLIKIIQVIDRINERLGQIFAWLSIPLILGLSYEVIARYFFKAPTEWAFDVTYMLYGSIFMLGAAYTLLKGGHIRTDIFYQNWSVRKKGILDAVSYLVFFFPGMLFFLLAGWDYAFRSFQQQELAMTSPWRPPIWPFKMVIPISIAFLIMQGLSEFIKSAYAALKGQALFETKSAEEIAVQEEII